MVKRLEVKGVAMGGGPRGEWIRLAFVVAALALPSVAWAQKKPAPPPAPLTPVETMLKTRFQNGSVLKVRVDGILGVPVTSPFSALTTFKDGRVHPAGTLQLLIVQKQPQRSLGVGASVRLQATGIDIKHDNFQFAIVELDCGGDCYKAVFGFVFGKGTLATMGPEQVFSVIQEVFVVDTPVDSCVAGSAGTPPLGKYISKDVSRDYFVLAADGTFRLFQSGKNYDGTYSFQGDVLTVQGKKIRRYDLRLICNALVGHDGSVYESEAQLAQRAASLSSAAAAPAAPPALASIAPPPPPPDQPTPSVSLGQSKEEVVAAFGQPTRIANLGNKQILYYADFKVTLVDGKVTDVQ